MKTKTIFLTIALIFRAGAVFAQEDELNVKDVTENLQHRYTMIDDATIQFEKHIKLGYSNIEQSFSGTLIMKKPNRYHLESDFQTIVTNGSVVWAYSSANKQVIIDKYKENNNSISPEQFVLNLPSNYYATLLSLDKNKSGNIINLKLVPKDDRSFIKSVKLSVEEQSWLIRKIVIIDVNETQTTYSIKDIKLNSNIPEKTFTFEPPAGVEVVDIR